MNPINPYSTLSPKIKTALDSIIAGFPLNPTFDNLNDALFNALFLPNPPADDLTIVYIKSVLPNVYNGYAVTSNVVEKHQTNYTEKQQLIISSLLQGMKTVKPENIPSFLASVEEKIATTDLSIAEQTPLFVATAAGKAVYEYWLLNIPQPSAWAAYMVNPAITPQAMDAVNYSAMTSWVSASMQGVLLAWGSISLPKIEFVDMMAAVIGSVGMSAGKVVFKW